MRARQVAMAGLAAVALPLLAVLTPSVASAAEPTAKGCAQADRAIVGAVAPTGSQARGDGKGTATGKDGSGTHDGEILATNCFTRSSDTEGRIALNWKAIGHLYEGGFFYQLVDCQTGDISDLRTRTIAYPKGTPDDVHSGSAAAVVPLEPGHTYKPRVWGSGKYDRSEVFGMSQPGLGFTGHFSMYDNLEVLSGESTDKDANKFLGDGTCS